MKLKAVGSKNYRLTKEVQKKLDQKAKKNGLTATKVKDTESHLRAIANASSLNSINTLITLFKKESENKEVVNNDQEKQNIPNDVNSNSINRRRHDKK